ncbi:MAG: hypothetical protein IT437_04820 [Phycisphaerales bacterium]|nr:hypothetical protein [Phycisphaerales bacterium]
MSTEGTGISGLASGLARVRAKARRLLVLSAVCWVLAAALAWVLGAAGVDYLLRMPSWMRGVLLLVGFAGLGAAILRWVGPAWRFRPGLTEVALRLERTPEAASAGLTDMLASGLELAEAPAPTPVASWMSAQVVQGAIARSSGLRASSLIKGAVLRDGGLALLAAAVLVLGTGAMVGPGVAKIGAMRVLAPWSGAAWPKRTQVADATAVSVHALGAALPLRAVLVRTDREPGQTRVEARYRVITADGAGPVQTAVLTGQGERNSGGEMYERLIEPAGLLPGGTEVAEMEYWFQTPDDRTRPARIRLATPPSVLSARAMVRLPAYAEGSGAAASFVSGARDLGGGTDRRAVVAPVLSGSTVELALELSKPVPAPRGDAEIAAALPGLAAVAGVGHEFGARAWRVEWTVQESARVPVVVTDEFGLRAADEPTFAIDVTADRAPTAAVTAPAQDEAVLATAVIGASGEGRDDVGVESVRVDAQPARRAAGSVGAAPEAAGEARVVASEPAGGEPRDGAGADPVRMVASGTVTLGDFGLRPGDELWLTAVAADAYEMKGVRHDAARSPVRKLRVISADELVEQVRGELSRMRDAAIRLDAEQAELRQSIGTRGAVTDDERRRQAGLSQRLAQQKEAAQDLTARIERNRLTDEALGGTLRDATDQLEGARGASERAAVKADQAAGTKPAEETRADLTPEQSAEIGRAQDEVRDELGRLIQMLDRGQDSWTVRRDLQRLVEQQKSLQAQTRQAGERTTGREMNELTPGERTELDRLAAEQRELALRTERALESLQERAEQMQKVDAAQAAAMKQAAERGRQKQVPQAMEKASQSAQKNQTEAAQEQQQDAIESMEDMLSDLENAERNRDEALRRMLASVIESIQGLIRQQQDQLAGLEIARGTRDFLGLDAGMVRLNQNTLGVLGESKSAFREMEDVSRPLEAAADAQAAAVGRLRASPVDDEGAGSGERESLRNLELAKAAAQQLQDEARQRDQDKKRQELRKVYREALELQVALRDEAAPMLGVQLDRRDRMKLRGMGERQESIRQMLAELKKRTDELDEAVVFGLAHERLDGLTAGSAKRLRAGDGSRVVGRQQDGAVRLLQSLVEALSQDANQEDEFKDAPGGDEGGGQAGGGQPTPLIPDLAEIRLLRGLQVQAAELTRAIDEGGAPDAAEVSDLAKFQQSLAEKGQTLLKKINKSGGEEPGP